MENLTELGLSVGNESGSHNIDSTSTNMILLSSGLSELQVWFSTRIMVVLEVGQVKS